MKIIQLIQKPQRRGAEIFAAQLSEQLKLSGNETLLVSIFEGEAALPFSGEFIKMNRPISNRFFDFKGWSLFAKIVREFKPDIIQANAADTLKFSVFSKNIFRWDNPIIYRNANQMGDFIRNSFHQKFNQFLLNKVSGIISVSEASSSNLHKTFRYPQDKSIVIPIGIDIVEIERGLKLKLDLKLPENYLLQIGGLVPEKDPLMMLSIFSAICKKHPSLHLVFLGSGPLKDKMLANIEELGIKEKVHLIPSQKNIFPILSKAKMLVMPSKIEGIPGVILEAMYCKVPVAAYLVGGIREVLIKGKTGWGVMLREQDDFEVVIKEILKFDLKRKEIILKNAYKLVNSKFSINIISNHFTDSYFFLLLKSKKI